jgi:hypothetical protein
MSGLDRLFCVFMVIVALCAAMNVVLYTFLDNETRRNHTGDIGIAFGVGEQLRNFARKEDNKLVSNLNAHAGFNLHGEINVRRDSTGGIVDNNKQQAEVPAVVQDIKSLNDSVLNIQQSNKNQGAKDNNAKSNDKEGIIKILTGSGVALTPEDIAQIPTWSEVTSLYGTKPQIVGLDQCKHFQLHIPTEDAYVGPSGLFNTGTNLLAETMQNYCTIPSRSNVPKNKKAPLPGHNGEPPLPRKVSGMLWQVPWGKHNPISWRMHHNALVGSLGVDQTHVLPVAIIKDPFHWMGSMCRHSYSANWYHDPQHCPNLVPNERDIGKRGITMANKSVPVNIAFKGDQLEHYDSLLHLWNDWYGNYLDVQEVPRLIIRFEDLLFHLEEIVTEICHCVGGTVINSKKGIHLQSGAAKKGEFHSGSNGLLSAISRYGSKKHRLDTMTEDDIQYANKNVGSELMKTFHYNYPEATLGNGGDGTVSVAA